LWCSIGQPAAPEIQPAWQRLHDAAGTNVAGVLLLRNPRGLTDGVVVVERFQAVADIAPWRTRCESLQRIVTSVWSAAVERTTGAWTRFWNQRRAALSPWNRAVRRVVWTAAMIGGAVAALTMIPAELVITGEGKLQPAVRRDIFATATGIVDEVRVQHGATVHKGDVLLVLRDPALELEAARIAGELATARARMNVVQAARISGSGTGDPTLRAQQLAGEEEELRQRIESYMRQ